MLFCTILSIVVNLSIHLSSIQLDAIATWGHDLFHLIICHDFRKLRVSSLLEYARLQRFCNFRLIGCISTIVNMQSINNSAINTWTGVAWSTDISDRPSFTCSKSDIPWFPDSCLSSSGGELSTRVELSGGNA